MVLFNYSTKELTAKVVYYGPGLCGKTTNLQWIHEKLPIKNKGKMLSLATETDRTLFFDFLPIELGTIRGMKTRIQLYTVPGQVFYNATRRMVLKGADCVVFVADSQDAMLEANAESLENLKENLEVNDISLDDVPLVMQYNKRDLPNALPIDQLNARLNPRGVPYYEAVAVKGVGVEETLKGVTSLVFRSLATRYGGPEGKAAASKTSVPAPNVVRPSAAAAAPPAPARIPPPPPSAPPPVPPPPPARATGSFSPSDLLDADPVEVGPEEMELDLDPAEDSADALEELSLDELGTEPAPAVTAPPDEEAFDLDLELDEPPPVETVDEFSPLSELEGFAPPSGASASFGATTQPRPTDDDPLAGLGGDAPATPGAATAPLGGAARPPHSDDRGGFDPTSLGDSDETHDPGSLLESEPEPSPAPEPPPAPAGLDPSAALSPSEEPEPPAGEETPLDLSGFGEPGVAAGDDGQELGDLLDAPSEPEAPPLPEAPPEAPPLPEPEPEAPPLPEPEAPDPVLELSMDDADADPLAGLDEPAAAAQPTAPFPAVQEEDPLSGLGDDPFGEPAPEAPPPPLEEPASPSFEPEPERAPEAPPLPEPEPAAAEPAPESAQPPPPPRRPEPARTDAAPQTARAPEGAFATATVERAITPTVGSVALAGGGAENDITIPVEVTLGPGGATQINLNIRLTLNFKLQ